MFEEKKRIYKISKFDNENKCYFKILHMICGYMGANKWSNLFIGPLKCSVILVIAFMRMVSYIFILSFFVVSLLMSVNLPRIFVLKCAVEVFRKYFCEFLWYSCFSCCGTLRPDDRFVLYNLKNWTVILWALLWYSFGYVAYALYRDISVILSGSSFIFLHLHLRLMAQFFLYHYNIRS